MSEIAKQIQSLLKKSGKSHYQIAKEAGISESTLFRVRKEDWGKQLETAQKVLGAMGKELIITSKKG